MANSSAPSAQLSATTVVWLDYCAEVVGPDDASFAITAGRLNVREWQFLYADKGTLTVADLANIEPTTLEESFATHSVRTQSPRRRLADAVRRAQMTVAGVDFEPLLGGGIDAPSADIEVDYDIEWDRQGRIYQWGLRVRENQDERTARYEPIVSFDPLDAASEAALADAFADRINALVADADEAGKSFAIYHWHHVEITRTRKFDRVQSALEGRTTDLLGDWFGKQVFARGRSSIKTVAKAFDFEWGVADPGGQFLPRSGGGRTRIGTSGGRCQGVVLEVQRVGRCGAGGHSRWHAPLETRFS